MHQKSKTSGVLLDQSADPSELEVEEALGALAAAKDAVTAGQDVIDALNQQGDESDEDTISK